LNSNRPPPTLVTHINTWSLAEETDLTGAAGVRFHVNQIREAGFEGYCGDASVPGLKDLIAEEGLRFGGAFSVDQIDAMGPAIEQILAVGDGPINCQLGDHDTPTDEAIQLTISLMEEAERQNAQVHLEVHRDTCTETPEKTQAIIDGFHAATGRTPRINYDFSHPAISKHLNPGNYVDRLLDERTIPVFQLANLWHIRPFNGHHCQIPITDGQGNFSPEYADCRPFIRQAIDHWLAGPRPGNELWIVPEQGTTIGYKLTCFPNIWQDTVVLGNDLKSIWAEALAEFTTEVGATPTPG
jgi:hypothetical protein